MLALCGQVTVWSRFGMDTVRAVPSRAEAALVWVCSAPPGVAVLRPDHRTGDHVARSRAPRRRRVSMQTRTRGATALAGIATLAVLATACGGSSSGGGGAPRRRPGSTATPRVPQNSYKHT